MVTALRILSSITAPSSSVPAAPPGKLAVLAQHLLDLSRRLLPLLASKDASAVLPQRRHSPPLASGPLSSRGLSGSLVTTAVATAVTGGRDRGGPRSSADGIPRTDSRAHGAALAGLTPGPVMDLVLQPIYSEHRSRMTTDADVTGTLAKQAAELLIAAGSGDDPRDDILDRLLPFWQPLFACDAAARAAYGGGPEHLTYWRVVRLLYSHAVETLGLSTVRKVVEGWRDVEAGLQASESGWQPTAPEGADEAALSLRQSLQVSLLQREPASSWLPGGATRVSIESTALLLGGVGWSAPPRSTSRADTTNSATPWMRWLPQTDTDVPSALQRAQTPLYQPALQDLLRPSHTAVPPVVPPWSTATPVRVMFQWPAHVGRLLAAAVSNCERVLLTAGRKDGSVHCAVRVWSMDTFSPGMQYLRHVDAVCSLAVVSVAEGIAASVDVGGALHLWRLRDAAQIATFQAGASASPCSDTRLACHRAPVPWIRAGSTQAVMHRLGNVLPAGGMSTKKASGGFGGHAGAASMRFHTCVVAAPCLGLCHAVSATADGCLLQWDCAKGTCLRITQVLFLNPRAFCQASV